MYRDETKNLSSFIRFNENIGVKDVVNVNGIAPVDLTLSIKKEDIDSPISIFGGEYSIGNNGASAFRCFFDSDVDFFLHLMIIGNDIETSGIIECGFEDSVMTYGNSVINLPSIKSISSITVTGIVFII